MGIWTGIGVIQVNGEIGELTEGKMKRAKREKFGETENELVRRKNNCSQKLW